MNATRDAERVEYFVMATRGYSVGRVRLPKTMFS